MMMTEYDNSNRGALWPNDKYQPDTTQPRFKGNLDVDGVEYWVSAWTERVEPGSNRPSIKLSIKRKDEAKARELPAPGEHELDDIPW